MDAIIEAANVELQMAPPPPPESYGDWRADLKANEGWVKAIAQDERAARAGSRVQNTSRPARSWQSRQASFRAKVDRQKTDRGMDRKMQAWRTPATPSAPYVKGSDSIISKVWDKFWTAAWKVLGIS